VVLLTRGNRPAMARSLSSERFEMEDASEAWDAAANEDEEEEDMPVEAEVTDGPDMWLGLESNERDVAVENRRDRALKFLRLSLLSPSFKADEHILACSSCMKLSRRSFFFLRMKKAIVQFGLTLLCWCHYLCPSIDLSMIE
jgi:hypothetical protein